MAIDHESIRRLDKLLIARYSERLNLFGNDPKTLGWDSTASQDTRFAKAVRLVEFEGRSVLDVGCGLADFCEFLERRIFSSPLDYTGLDINPELIKACQTRFPHKPFSVGNILLDLTPGAKWDVVTMFGLLNLRFSEFGNIDFAREMIVKAFSLTRDTLIVDMLSELTDASYPVENFVYYYKPDDMLRFALTLTPYVSISHDYPSIPQREFMIVMRKQPCG